MNSLLRFVVGTLGSFFVYLAFFVTVDEQGEISNRLDALRKRIQEVESKAVGWQTVFLRVVSAWFAEGVQNIFGSRVFSTRSVGSSAVVCASPIGLAYLVFGTASLTVKVVYALFFLYFAAEATSKENTNDFHPGVPNAVHGLVLVCISPMLHHWWTFFGGYSMGDLGVVTYLKELCLQIVFPAYLLFSICVLLVMLLAGLNRSIAKRSATTGNPWIFFTLLPANAACAAALAVPGWFGYEVFKYLAANPQLFGQVDLQPAGNLLVAVTAFELLSLVPILAAAIIVFLIVVPLVHRIFWPLAWRPVYAAHHYKLLEQHKLLFSVGSFCLWKAWPTNPIVGFIHNVLSEGGGGLPGK